MKRLLTLVLSLVLCVSLLAGCGGGSSEPAASENTESSAAPAAPAAPEGTPAEKVKVVFWYSMAGRNGEAIEALIKDFNESQDAVVVEGQYQGAYDDAITKLRSTPKGSGPDIMQLYDIGTRWMIDSGYALRVQDFIDRDNYDISDIEPNIAAYYTLDNVLYSLPFNSSTPCIVYNKEALEKAGVDPTKDLADFAAVSAAGKKIVDSGAAEVGVAIPNYSWLFEQFVSQQDKDFADNGNGRKERATSVVFDSNGAGEAIVKAWKELNAQPYAKNFGNTDETKQPFGQGKVGIIMESCAVYTNMQSAAQGAFNVGLAPLPKVDASVDQGGPSVGGGSLWIMDNASDEKANGAWEFIKYAGSPEAQAKWSIGTGYLPISAAAAETDTFKKYIEEENPDFQIIINALRGSKPQNAGAILGVFPQARQIIQNEMEIMMNDSASVPAEVVKKMAEQINSEIEMYNRTN